MPKSNFEHWEELYAREQAKDLVRRMLGLFKGLMESKKKDDDSFSDHFSQAVKDKYATEPWRYNVLVGKKAPRRCYTDIFPDPDDWIDGFCKHIEIEALLDE